MLMFFCITAPALRSAYVNEGHCVADSWLGLHVSGALPTSNGTRQYLQLTEVAQIVHLLQDDT